MEEFWADSPAWGLLRELGLPLDEDGAHSSLILDGRLHTNQGDGDRDTYLAGMFDPQEAAEFLRWGERVDEILKRVPEQCVDLSSLDWAEPLIGVSFAAYVAATVSEHRVCEWIRIVVESETAIEWECICALDGLAEMRPFLDSASSFGESNGHVVGGNQRFVEAIAAQLPAGTVRTESTVTCVRDAGAHIEVHHGFDGEVSRCEQVVLAVPLWSLGDIALEPAMEPTARAGLNSSSAGSYVKVLLRVRPEAAELCRPHGDGLFTVLTDSAAGCIYLGEGEADQDLLLTLLVHAQHARNLCGRSAPEIALRTVQSLDALSAPLPLWPGLGDLVTESRVFAYPNAVAYWPVKRGRSRYDALAAALRRPQGRVHLASDTLESSHSDGAIRSGHRVARTLIDVLAGQS